MITIYLMEYDAETARRKNGTKSTQGIIGGSETAEHTPLLVCLSHLLLRF